MRTSYLQTHHVAGVDVIPIPPFTLCLKGNRMMKHQEGGLGVLALLVPTQSDARKESQEVLPYMQPATAMAALRLLRGWLRLRCVRGSECCPLCVCER